jgi:zinc protease
VILRLALCAIPAFAAFAQAPVVPPPNAVAPQTPPGALNRPAARPASIRTPALEPHKDLKFPPLRLLEAPAPIRFQLPNGMKVLLLEDHETPLVTATAVVRTGSAFDTAERAGLASITGSLLRTGGTGSRPPERLDAELELLGATIDSGMGESVATVKLSVLRENLAEALGVYRDVLSNPAFRQDKLDTARATLGQSVLRRNDDVRDLANREFRAIVYGRDTEAGRQADYSTLSRISRADVVAFYKRYYFPANIVLAISGDFDAAQLKGGIETIFSSWKEQQPAVELPKLEPRPAPGGYVALRPELRNTLVCIGQIGGVWGEPDGAALEVATAALGMGPNSRLVARARESRGAILEIRAEWLAGFGRPGMFVVTAGGPSRDTGETVRAVLEEIQKLRSFGISEEELRAGRDAVLAKFVSGWDSKARAVTASANLEYYGYPPDSIATFQKAVAAVTRADVLRAAKSRLDPEQMSVLAISNLSAFSKPLDPRGGATKVLDLTVPTPASGTTATASSTEVGKALLARAQQAVGGAARLEAVKDYSQTATYLGADGSREVQTDRWVTPSHLRQDAQSSTFGLIYRYVDSQGGWVSNGRGSAALVGVGLHQAQAELVRAYIPMLLSDRLPGRAMAALDDQTVEISSGDIAVRLVLDPQTGLPARLLYELRSERQAVVFVEEEYSDFREISGVKAPFLITVRRNGLKHATGTISDFKINVGTKPEVLLRRP